MFLCSHFISRVFHHMFCGPQFTSSQSQTFCALELTSSQERSVKHFVLQTDEKVMCSENPCGDLFIFGNTNLPYMRAQKSFSCVDFPKTKPKTISNSPKRYFQVFRFSTRGIPFVIWICLKMLKIFETRFEILCPKIAIRVLSSHLFAFGEFLGRLRCKKIWHQLRPSESAKSG